MVHEISSEQIKVQIQHSGIELSSIQSKNTGMEYMWQADPEVWGSSAPVLFPIIGALKNNSYLLDGKAYSMPKHGIVRGNPNHEVIESLPHQITLSLEASDETLQQYPFRFSFITRFSVKGHTLTVSHRVENSGNQTLPFTLGAHPAFRCPLHNGDSYSDYALLFEHAETLDRHLIDIPTGLISNSKERVLSNESRLPLTHDLFDRDALVFKNTKSKRVTLSHITRGKQLSIQFPSFPHLGIWAKPNGDFICIEPWFGTADPVDHNGEFIQKEGMQFLVPGGNFEASYSITVHE
jgi:galactose mutarotase-like enzyme